MRNFLLSLCLCWLCLSPLPATSANVIVQSGHQGRVNTLAFHSSHVLISAGEDGTVKIWDARDNKLLDNLRISHLPVQQLILHPQKTQFVVLIKTSLTSSLIMAYDWTTGKKLFSLELAEVPIFFSYSTRGSYFIYGRAEWNSLVLCDSATGRNTVYLKEGFGIVSFVATSEDEKTIMAYQPSGKIFYKKVLTGADVLGKPLSTIADLKNIKISSNNRFIAAVKGRELLVVNVVTGAKVASLEKENILALAINPDDTEIMCLAKLKNRSQLFRYTITAGGLIEKPVLQKIPHNITDFLYRDDAVYYAAENGELYSFSGNGEIVYLAGNMLCQISDLAISVDYLAIATWKRIILADLRLIEYRVTEGEEYQVFPNLLAGDSGLEFFKPNKLLIWSRESKPAGFYLLDINSGEKAGEFFDYSSPLMQLDIVQSGILTLEQAGLVRLLTKRDFEHIFQYKANGLNKVINIANDTLVAARSKTSDLGSSLLRINPETGETVPLISSSLLCFDLIYDEARDRLFSLCMTKEQDQTFTDLRMHYGKGYERESVISRFKGEDLAASIVLDDSGRYLYSSLGFDRIEVYNGFGKTTLAGSEAIPRKLYLSGKLLFAINRDSSITILNRNTGVKLFDLYLLDTAEFDWIAVSGAGQCYASEKGWDYLRQTGH